MVIILIAATIFIFAIVCFFTHYSQKSKDVRLRNNSELREAFLDEADSKDKRRVLEEIRLAEIDLLYHVARVYCIGNNTPYNSWIIPAIPPKKLESLINNATYRTWTDIR